MTFVSIQHILQTPANKRGTLVARNSTPQQLPITMSHASLQATQVEVKHGLVHVGADLLDDCMPRAAKSDGHILRPRRCSVELSPLDSFGHMDRTKEAPRISILSASTMATEMHYSPSNTSSRATEMNYSLSNTSTETAATAASSGETLDPLSPTNSHDDMSPADDNDGILGVGPKVTLVFRNIAAKMTQLRFLNILLQGGFEATFDALYVPQCSETWQAKGYAFVRFLDEDYAQQAMQYFHGRTQFLGSRKAFTVQPAKLSIKIFNLIAMVKHDPQMVPEMQPMLFDEETGNPKPLPIKKNIRWQSVAQRKDMVTA